MKLTLFLIIAHPSCIQMSQRMYVRSLAYSWQCSSCKSCSKCRKSKDNKMLYCIQCDRGFHIYCLGLRNVPEGKIKEKFIKLSQQKLTLLCFIFDKVTITVLTVQFVLNAELSHLKVNSIRI